MRDLINLFEAQHLSEIEIGGDVDGTHLDDLKAKHNFEPRQLTLFPRAPSEPTFPDKFTYMGRLGAYFVARTKEERSYGTATGAVEYTYYLFDNGDPIMYVGTLHPKSEFGGAYAGRNASNPQIFGEGLRVVSIFLDPSARGQGLAVAMYEWLLQNVCDYILPDDLQTPGGVHIWKQLVRDRARFDVMVFNPEQHTYYRAKPGAIWANVYKSYNLFPFVTLAGKSDDLIDS